MAVPRDRANRARSTHGLVQEFIRGGGRRNRCARGAAARRTAETGHDGHSRHDNGKTGARPAETGARTDETGTRNAGRQDGRRREDVEQPAGLVVLATDEDDLLFMDRDLMGRGATTARSTSGFSTTTPRATTNTAQASRYRVRDYQAWLNCTEHLLDEKHSFIPRPARNRVRKTEDDKLQGSPQAQK